MSSFDLLDGEPITTEPQTLSFRVKQLEDLVLPPKLSPSRPRSPASPKYSNPRHHLSRSRSRSPSHIRRRRRYESPVREYLPVLINSTSLRDFLTSTSSFSDALVEIQSGTGLCNAHMAHLTAIPTHQAELDKLSWVFTTGAEDCWVQQPSGRETLRFGPSGIQPQPCRAHRDIDRYDSQYEDRFQKGSTPIVKLGEIFTTIFKDGGDENVKFLIIIQGKNTFGWLKLVTSYSTRGALVDIFHELVNGYSILFVGAVLADVDLSNVWKLAGTKNECVFEKVGGVEEALKMKDRVVGVIC